MVTYSLKVLRRVVAWLKRHQFSLRNLRQSSEIFGKCLEKFVWPSDLWKIVKKLSFVHLDNKQNNTWLLVHKKFLFSYSTWYYTHLLRSLMRYRVEHLKRNSISTHTHVLFSTYYIDKSVLLGTKQLVDSIRHFIRDPSGVFSVCHLCECRIVHWYQVCLLNCT